MGALSVIWAPVRTLRGVSEGRRVLPGFVVTALYAALGLVTTTLTFLSGGFSAEQLAQGGQPLPPEFEGLLAGLGVFALLVALLTPFVYWLGVSGVMHLVTRFFGGRGPFAAILAAVGVAQVPLVVSAAISLPLTALQIVLSPGGPSGAAAADPAATLPAALVSLLAGLIGLAAFVWFVVLVVIGSALARRVGYGESAGSCAISCAGCLGLILVVVIVLGVVIAVSVGALGGGAS